MPSKFDLVFSRAGNDVMAEMFGSERLALINSLRHRNRGDQLSREILLETFTRASILYDKKRRASLLSLLRPEEAADILDLMGVRSIENDAYTKLLNLNIKSAQLKQIFKFLEVDIPADEVTSIQGDREEVFAEYGLFKHQRNAVKDVVDILKSSPYRVVLHMPTGAGKTRTAMNIIAQFLRTDEPSTVLWLANSEELCEQAATEFTKCWNKIGNRAVEIQRFWGSHNELNASDGLVVAGFKKMHNKFIESPPSLARFGEAVRLIVVDEAHQVIATTYREVVDAINSRNTETAIVGLTATPGRTWNEMDKDQELSLYFDRKKVSLKVDGYENPVDYLINDGYLAKPSFKVLKLSSFNQDEIKQIYRNFDIPENLLKKLADDQVRTLAIISEIEQLAIKHRRILVFATTVEHSETIAIMMRLKGYSSKAVSSKTGSYERKNIIDWYKDEDTETKILCNFGILTTGFDAPQTSAAVIARPTKSLVLFSQMVGRATRGVRANGNKEAEIITVVDVELPGFGDLTESFNNWEDIWHD